MPTEAVLCSQCGAPLDVPLGVMFVTCKQCGVGLRVKHEASVAYTEVMEKLSRTTDELSEQVAGLQRSQELDRIDREWQRERESLMVTSKHGRTYVPTVESGVLAMVVGGGFGIFWTIMACGMTGAMSGHGPASGFGAIFPVFGVIFTVLAVVLGISNIEKAKRYKRAERSYRQRRAALARDD